MPLLVKNDLLDMESLAILTGLKGFLGLTGF